MKDALSPIDIRKQIHDSPIAGWITMFGSVETSLRGTPGISK